MSTSHVRVLLRGTHTRFLAGDFVADARDAGGVLLSLIFSRLFLHNI